MLIAILIVALAQTLSVTIPPATEFKVSFDYEGPLPSVRWWCDGGILQNYRASQAVKAAVPNADGTFTYTLTVPGLAAGSHSCFVSAWNDQGEAKSTPLVFPVGTPAVVGKPPNVPVNIRIVVGGGA